MGRICHTGLPQIISQILGQKTEFLGKHIVSPRLYFYLFSFKQIAIFWSSITRRRQRYKRRSRYQFARAARTKCYRLGSMHNRNSFSFINKIIFKIYFGCTGSLLLHRLFFSFDEQQLLSSCGAQASHCGGFSCCRAQALGHMGFSSYIFRALESRLNSCGSWAQFL